eukprot:TRINITY_DN1268_c0_g2_i4.p1 TRINITY_DN1268_c0_g2~~TRINITY_DN1268_c0_g2_i4.p1  ORF type:complete len:679 (+),score=187.91 TRINITY_DN1268_c0_g2_i4:74-2038(+)
MRPASSVAEGLGIRSAAAAATMLVACYLRRALGLHPDSVIEVDQFAELFDDLTEACGNPTVADLKEGLQLRYKIPPSVQRVFLAGRLWGCTELDDDKQTLREAGVQAGSVLTVAATCAPERELERRLAAKDGLGRDIARRVDNVTDFYTDLKRIGRGSYGQVFRGVRKGDQELGAVALKFCPKRLACTWTATRHLLSEIATLSALRHPRIATLIEVLHTSEYVVLVSQFAPGKEVFDLVIERGGVDMQTARVILRQLLLALSFCHRSGVAHRDVKPENLIVHEKTLYTRLLDFGMARYVGETPSSATGAGCATPGTLCLVSTSGSSVSASASTLCTPFVGTAVYMPYEGLGNVLSGKSCKTRPELILKADMHSAGAVMYAMLTCRVPYGDVKQSRAELCRRRLRMVNPTELLGSVAADVRAAIRSVEGLESLMIKMLDSNPVVRPSADEVLRSPALQVDVPADEPVPPPPPPSDALVSAAAALRDIAAGKAAAGDLSDFEQVPAVAQLLRSIGTGPEGRVPRAVAEQGLGILLRAFDPAALGIGGMAKELTPLDACIAVSPPPPPRRRKAGSPHRCGAAMGAPQVPMAEGSGHAPAAGAAPLDGAAGGFTSPRRAPSPSGGQTPLLNSEEGRLAWTWMQEAAEKHAGPSASSPE